jgi:propane monooxygenase reductase subunit
MTVHRVRFEPVGIEIAVDEDETVLQAAFRQGVSLTHGCKEGQCSSCKSLLLAGDLEMDKYSTFARADYEHEQGYVLLCRSHAYSDLVGTGSSLISSRPQVR